MDIFEKIREVFATEEEHPSHAEVAQARKNAIERKNEVKDELESLRRERGDVLLQSEEAVDAHDQRVDELETELDRLEAAVDRLTELEREARIRRDRRRLAEIPGRIPDLVDRIVDARREIREASGELDEILTTFTRTKIELDQKADEAIYLRQELVERIREVEGELGPHQLEKLVEPSKASSERRIVLDVESGNRVFVGSWTQERLREAGFRQGRDRVVKETA